jgi:hypothetical protein
MKPGNPDPMYEVAVFAGDEPEPVSSALTLLLRIVGYVERVRLADRG